MLNIDSLPSARDIPSLYPSNANEALVLSIYESLFAAIAGNHSSLELEWLADIEVSHDQVNYAESLLKLKGFNVEVIHEVPSKEVSKHPSDEEESDWEEFLDQPSTFVFKVTW